MTVAGPGDRVYFAEAGRIRTIEADGRLRTLVGNGKSGPVQPGPALESPLPSRASGGVGQIAVSPAGILHFSAAGRLFRIDGDRIVAVAGTGRHGFNGEAAPPLELNLGDIVHFAFDPVGVLYLVDSFQRVRRLGADGVLRTFAGSSSPPEFGGVNGDGGPAVNAALEGPSKVMPLREGTVWIHAGSSLRAVGPDGAIRRLRDNFFAPELLLTPEGNPAWANEGLVMPLDSEGQDRPPALFAGFTGNPRAIGNLGLYVSGPRADLFRWRGGAATLIGAAPPRAPTPGIGTESFGAWVEPTASLIYRGVLDGIAGLIESRAGEPLRLIAGRGTDTGNAEGKSLESLSIRGLAGYTASADGRLILLDLNRLAVLIVAADGKVSNLKNATGQPVTTAPGRGSLSNPARVAEDAAGNIYWTVPDSSLVGRVYVWTRSTATVTSYLVPELVSLLRLPNGFVAGIVGPTQWDRTLVRLEAGRVGAVEAGLQGIGFHSATLSEDTPYFVFAPRLFRGRPGSIEAFVSLSEFASGFVLNTGRGLIIQANGTFYRLENPEDCAREPQPKIAEGGIVSAAGFGYPDAVSSWQLLTVFGSGLGPREGQGISLDGLGRASSQPAPHPTLQLGPRPLGGPSRGDPLPVVFASDTQMTVQVPLLKGSAPTTLYWSWNGLLLSYPKPLPILGVTPGIFVQGAGRDGPAAALNQDSTLNSPQRPAERGSVVQFYLTGLGRLTPPLAGPGAFNSAIELQRTAEPVIARIGGQTAAVEFAGGAPGFIGGLYQVNVRVPPAAATGAQAVEFDVAGRSTQTFQKVTIQVQ